MTEEDNMRVAINSAITKHWKKLVKDSKQVAGYNYNQYGEDLLLFCLSEFLTKKSLEYQFKVCVIDDKVCNYIGRSMSLNIRSNSSPFWNKYRKESYNSRGVYTSESDPINIQNSIEETYEIDARDCIMNYIEKLDFYHKALIEDYYINGLTYKEMHKKYGITLFSLKNGVKEGLEIIKNHCKGTKI
jgi:hypothetical protein